MKTLIVTILTLAASIAYTNSLPTCGKTNYDYHWGCMDKIGIARPYCDKLIAPIHPQSYCYDGFREIVTTWEQFQGKSDPCYIPPDVFNKDHDDPNCTKLPEKEKGIGK